MVIADDNINIDVHAQSPDCSTATMKASRTNHTNIAHGIAYRNKNVNTLHNNLIFHTLYIYTFVYVSEK